MARKKIIDNGYIIKYIPSGSLKQLQELAQAFPFIADKHIALCKYIEALSSIIERSLSSDNGFVAVSQRILKKKLGLETAHTAKILKDLIATGLLQRDKSPFEIGEHSWEYKPFYTTLDTLRLTKTALNKKTTIMLEDATVNYTGDLLLYKNCLDKIQLDDSVKLFMKSVCDNDNNIHNNNNNITTNNTNNIIHPYCNSFVPVEIIGKIPSKFIAVNKIMACKIKVNRPNADSRVYSTITNLARIFRPYLRLNGQPLIGFDIANSQPLIAAIAFRMYSESEYGVGVIKEDVLQYQQACETGLFYEHFMKLNNIDTTDDEARTAFKKEFFGKVFYTKEIEKENYLKTQFKEKYPTCYEAIFAIKGGLYSKTYADFPKLMTEIETHIMWQTNIEMIKEGYNVINIFDSLYSDSKKAIEKAKAMVTTKFQEYGICPKVKDIDYTNASQEQDPAPVATECITEGIEREFESLCTAQDRFQSIEYYLTNYNHDLAIEMYKNQELITI
jgi:hypothetical protein